MAIYLGSAGHIKLKRPTTDFIATVINPADINVKRKRLSIDFYGLENTRLLDVTEVEDSVYNFITGDRLEFRTIDSSENLGFIPDSEYGDNKPHRSVTRYVHIDAVGGMRLFKTFGAAINGEVGDAISLQDISKSQKIEIRSRQNASSDWRCLGNVTSYEIVSDREAIDTTLLSQAYRHQYEAGLIQGSGRISTFWEYKYETCGPNNEDEIYAELPYFLAATVLRLEQGGTFVGRFYLNSASNARENLYYNCPSCIITNCSVNVEPESVITADIDFIVNGKIQLKYGVSLDLLKQDGTLRSDDYIIEDSSGKPIELIGPNF